MAAMKLTRREAAGRERRLMAANVSPATDRERRLPLHCRR
jgi:hypothetical protein